MSKRSGESCHRKTEIGEFKEFDSQLRFDIHREVDNAVVEVMAFAISLENVGELRVVDIVDLVRREESQKAA